MGYREIRYLVFDPEDLAEAIARHRKQNGMPLPAGTVASLELSKGKRGIETAVRVAADNHDTAIEFALDETELKQALIQHCRQRRIPLPQRAPKQLEITGQSLSLMVLINVQAELRTVSENAVRYEPEDVDAVRSRVAEGMGPANNDD